MMAWPCSPKENMEYRDQRDTIHSGHPPSNRRPQKGTIKEKDRRDVFIKYRTSFKKKQKH